MTASGDDHPDQRAADHPAVIELPVDRAIYAVDRATRTYRYARRNPVSDRLDPALNQANKRSLDGYTRIFPDGRTKLFAYRPPHPPRGRPALHQREP